MKPLLVILILLFTGLATGLMAGCSSFLYYPDNVMYVSPEKLPTPPKQIVLGTKQKILSWYFETKEKKAKGLFIVFHGNAQNRSSHFLSSYWVLEKGYNLLVFDYPGYGGSDGKPSPENTLESGLKVVRYAQSKWPKMPLIILGQSLGGAIAMKTLVELEDRKNLCALVIESSFASYKQAGNAVLSKHWITWLFQWLPYVVLSDTYSPKGEVDKISPLPMIIFHRRNDPVVPYYLGERIYDHAKEPKKMFALDGGGHINAFFGPGAKKNKQHVLDLISSCDERDL